MGADLKPGLASVSVGAPVHFSYRLNSKELVYRINYIEEQIRQKKVIHIGYCDHPEIIDFKIKQNTWLHKRLCLSAEKCIGIDINQLSVDYVRERYGFPGYCIDIMTDDIPLEIKQDTWDFVILGEVLEHIDDPITFLKTIKAKFDGRAAYILVTVPNAFRLINFKNIFKSEEFINSDHRWWFTPFTLQKACNLAGFKPEKVILAQGFKVPRYRIFKKILLSLYPGFRDTVIVLAKF